MISRERTQSLRKALYVLILCALGVFLYTLGASPWQHVAEHKSVFFQVLLINGLAILIQAQSFGAVQTGNSRRLDSLMMAHIWSLSAVVSVIAPIIAGIATRTTLLVQAGIPLMTCVTTTLRQTWMGIEYALLVGGLAGLMLPYQTLKYLSVMLLAFGFCMLAVRIARAHANIRLAASRWYRSVDFLRENVASVSHFWFIAQIGAMSAIYYAAFNGFGVSISVTETLMLSALTVLASLLILIPNGLGVMDFIWVAIATRSGLDLGQSAAIALVIRLSHLSAAALIFGVSTALKNRVSRGE